MKKYLVVLLAMICSWTCQAQPVSTPVNSQFISIPMSAFGERAAPHFFEGERFSLTQQVHEDDSLLTLFEPWDGNIMVAQTFLGALGFALGAGPFFLGGKLAGLIPGYGFGALVAIPLAVTWVGDAHGGNGSMPAAMAGALIPVGILVAVIFSEQQLTPAEIALLAAGHLAFPIIGYHLSATTVTGPPIDAAAEPARAAVLYDPLRPHSDLKMTFTILRF